MMRVTRASIGEGCRRDWIAGEECAMMGEDGLLAAWWRVGEYESMSMRVWRLKDGWVVG
jgi:hypothetical protein